MAQDSTLVERYPQFPWKCEYYGVTLYYIQASDISPTLLEKGIPYDVLDAIVGRGHLVKLLPDTSLQTLLRDTCACTIARLWVGGRGWYDAWVGTGEDANFHHTALRNWRLWFLDAVFNVWGSTADELVDGPPNVALTMMAAWASAAHTVLSQLLDNARDQSQPHPVQIELSTSVDKWETYARRLEYARREAEIEMEDTHAPATPADDVAL